MVAGVAKNKDYSIVEKFLLQLFKCNKEHEDAIILNHQTNNSNDRVESKFKNDLPSLKSTDTVQSKYANEPSLNKNNLMSQKRSINNVTNSTIDTLSTIQKRLRPLDDTPNTFKVDNAPAKFTTITNVPSHFNTVFVRGADLTQSILEKLFTGEVTINKDKRKNDCFYVRFKSQNEALNALNMNGDMVDGITLHISVAKTFSRGSSSRQPASNAETNPTVQNNNDGYTAQSTATQTHTMATDYNREANFD